MSVKDMAAASKVSLRFQKDVLKLHGMGYQDAIAQGYTMKQCFAHAGVKRTRRAMPKVGDLDDAVNEIKRLRRSSDCARCCWTSALTLMGKGTPVQRNFTLSRTPKSGLSV